GVFALEELKDIKKNVVKGKTGKTFRKMIGGWAFRQLAEFLEYKAEERGKVVVYVNPKDTSRRCSHCGHTEKDNRKGSSFVCKECGFSLNADLNAARNIAGLGISVFGRADSQTSQCSS
ncbi:MAG: RNA-guided endonuclease TnpB family protein, partial [Methanomassiliicoccaceae archaeon]|nr:RNA-guided endonuclease TnpB family protein [Methanomassiliicoccaceae archaeon]